MGIAPPAPVNMDTVKSVVDDLRPVKPGVYFLDLSICALAGWLMFFLALSPAQGTGLRALAFVASMLLLYRGIAFIHELFHQQAMKEFRIYWHAVVGVPVLIPFLLYLPNTPGTPQLQDLRYQG